MKIETRIEDVRKEGASISVKIRPDNMDSIPDILQGGFIAMNIVSILRALKDYNEKAFNIAMENFIEEELKNA